MNTPAMPHSAAPPGKPARARLQFIGEDSARTVELDGQPKILGRADDADIQLDSSSVSRRHAELRCDPFGRWHLRDLSSRNGSWVNGRQITEHMLVPGDLCKIGRFQFRFLLPASHGVDAAAASTGGGSYQDFTLARDDGAPVQRLADMAPARIHASHHTLLTEFGEALMRIDDPADRLQLLCRLMVQGDFNGQAALAVRMSRMDSSIPPQSLCPIQTSDQCWLDRTPYVSSRVLRAACESAAPVLGSNAADYSGVLDLSVSISHNALSAMACPLHVDEDAIDILYVNFPVKFGTGEWLALVSLASKQYQQAEANWIARRHTARQAAIEQELERARQVQLRFIPDARRLDGIGGLDVAIGFEACKWVGGDYVDVMPTDDGRILLLLADVSGKGMPAAMVTSVLHTMVHTSVKNQVSLATMFHHMNEHLCTHLEPNMFVTAVGLVIDPRTGAFEFVNAGHLPILVIRPDGTARPLQVADNLPLGITNVDFVMQQGHAAPTEMLTVYSDGLTEICDAQNQWIGYTRIGEELARLYAASPKTSMQSLVRMLSERIDQLESRQDAGDDRSFILARLP